MKVKIFFFYNEPLQQNGSEASERCSGRAKELVVNNIPAHHQNNISLCFKASLRLDRGSFMT